jgi:hypothetical protein
VRADNHIFEQVADKDIKPCFAKMIIENQAAYGLSDDETAYLAGSMFGAGAGTASEVQSMTVPALMSIYSECLRDFDCDNGGCGVPRSTEKGSRTVG